MVNGRPASTAALSHSPHPRDGRRSTVRQARLTINVRFHVYHYSAAAAVAAAYVSERGTASGIGFHGLTTETNAWHFTWKDVNTLLCYTDLHTSNGIGIGYWYRQWPILLDIGYWVAFLVSF